MGIAEEIKQKKFKSELQKALINISFTSSYLNSNFNKVFKPYNISMQQFNVLRILRGQHPEPVSINDITDRMIDKMSNASRLVEKLRLKDLVERTPCAFDRRQVDVKLTENGLNLLEELNEVIAGIHKQFIHVSEEEYAVLNNIMDKIRMKDE